jgi:hypothetical protein
MPIKVSWIKYLLMMIGVLFLFAALEDKNWIQAGEALPLIAILGLFGYGVERLWLYINKNPGGTRWSKFWIGR